MKILLFDLALGGHHSTYIYYLVRYWCECSLNGQLYLLVSPEFINKYPKIVQLSQNYPKTFVKFLSITEKEHNTWKNSPNFLKKIFWEWDLYCQYAKQLKIDHAVLMYLDHLQLPIAIKGNSPCSFSGIYFRPTFHYHTFENYHPTIKDKFRAWRQKLLLFYALGHPQLKQLLCLDPYVVPIINQQSQYSKAIYLADPIEVKPIDQKALAQLKEQLNMSEHRKVFLMFGRLDARKGIYQVLDAFESLSPDIAKQVTLLVIGELPKSEKDKILSKIDQITSNSKAEIITNYEFVPEDDVQSYFQLSDIVLATYQNHVGMSGILLQAAVANKPVISSDYGLMGQIAFLNKMGVVIDTSKLSSISNTITKIITGELKLKIDTHKNEKMRENHSYKKYSQTLFENNVNHLIDGNYRN